VSREKVLKARYIELHGELIAKAGHPLREVRNHKELCRARSVSTTANRTALRGGGQRLVASHVGPSIRLLDLVAVSTFGMHYGDDAKVTLGTDDISLRRFPTNRVWSRRVILGFTPVRVEMSQRAERRTRNMDPFDVLSPEVFALLTLCGGTREADRPATLEVGNKTASERRRQARRRGIDSACSPT
jgi:hypothetical protein